MSEYEYYSAVEYRATMEDGVAETVEIGVTIPVESDALYTAARELLLTDEDREAMKLPFG